MRAGVARADPAAFRLIMADLPERVAAPVARPSQLTAALLRREIWPWALLGVTAGLVEGATVAVLVKKGFAGVVETHWVNLAVALASGAPALANISSFAWSNLAHGRARVGVLTILQTTFALVVGLIALIPLGPAGLVLTIGAV
jgi:hypothetical protein